MLLPTKHSHPDETVLATATVILRQLRRKQAIPFDELRAQIPSRHDSAEYLFAPALSVLYLVGLLEYNSSIDSFIYTGD